MSFKALNDALRINAFMSFLRAASQLNGVLFCIAVEKGVSMRNDKFPARIHNWTNDTLNKLIEICIFGCVLVDGLRGSGQHVRWITDDDSTVSTAAARYDALNLMHGILHRYPHEQLDVALGVASELNDELQAEDLVAIPDLAAGAFSEMLMTMGKENMSKSDLGPTEEPLFLQLKSTIINTWRSEIDKPLKHMDVVIRPAESGQILLSFGLPFTRMLRPGESAEGAPTLNAKWRRTLDADLKSRSVDTNDVLKSMGIER